MASSTEHGYTAHIVIAADHAGLRPYFTALECEIYRVLARVDDPRAVVLYLKYLMSASEWWFKLHEQMLGEK